MLAKGPEGERKIVIINMPSYEDIMRNGIGRYLRDADATAEEIEAAKKAAD